MSARLVFARFTLVPWLMLLLAVLPSAPRAMETPSGAKTNEPSVTSPANLLPVLTSGAELLKKEIEDLRVRVTEANDALAKTERFTKELKISVATLRASLTVTSLTTVQVDEVVRSFAAWRETIWVGISGLEQENDALSKEQALRATSRDILRTQMDGLRAIDEKSVLNPETEKAYEEYSSLASARDQLIEQEVGINRQQMRLLQEGKGLLEVIEPQVSGLEEAWKAEITKRQTRLSTAEQAVKVRQTLLALPERAQRWLTRLIRSGGIGNFVLAHPTLLFGLLLVLILIGWLCRRLSRSLGPLFRAWRDQAEAVPLRTFWALWEVLVSSLFSIGFTLWLALAFQPLGLLKVNSARLVLYGLAAVVAIRLSLRLIQVFFAGEEAGGIIPLDGATAAFYRRNLKLLSITFFLGALGLSSAEALGFSAISRAFLDHLFQVVLQVWILWLLRPSYTTRLLDVLSGTRWPWLPKAVRGIRGVVTFLVTVIVLSDLLGFQGLSAYISESMTYSEGVILSWALLMLGVRVVLHFLLHPEDGWLTRRTEKRADLAKRSIGLAGRAFGVLLTTATFLAVVLAWGVSAATLGRLLDGLAWGVNIGPLRLTPLNLALVIIVLAAVRWCTRLGRSFLETRVLPRTGWDMGIQYTISMVVQYFIVFLGGLLALNILGFPMANLALVAGALGVGAGFGLQDIVKNFVSGLILLFERPIRVGDLLVIDGQWGEVKAIRMRSTVFQAFDRYVLIIPNSEMISSKILNWTHFGRKPSRLTLKVGVSYGSDVKEVTSVINEVCKSNWRVLEEPPPQICFSAYGDSSLDFAIWVHVRRPEDRIPATHELNSAIFEAFREHSIEIPFPQRDLHLKTWPEPARTVDGGEHD